MGLMATKKATQEYTTVEEEEVIVMNSQSIDSNSDGSKNIGSPRLWHSPDDKLNHLLEKRGGGGLKKVQMIMTPIIFLRNKRYGNP
jgi:hypothetical protein